MNIIKNSEKSDSEIDIGEDKEDDEEEEEVSQEKYVKIQLEINNKNGVIEAETVGKNKKKVIYNFIRIYTFMKNIDGLSSMT